MSIIERSLSRGRNDDFVSLPFLIVSQLGGRLMIVRFSRASIQKLTGRGGAGNYRSPSRGHPREPGPEDFSDTRGRDPISSRDPEEVCDLVLVFLVPLVSD